MGKDRIRMRIRMLLLLLLVGSGSFLYVFKFREPYLLERATRVEDTAQGGKENPRDGDQVDNLNRYKTGLWLNDSHLFVAANHSGSELSFNLNVPEDGDYILKIAGTRAPDFGIFSFTVGSTKVGSPIDFLAVSVRPTGPVTVGRLHCSKGEVTCVVRCEGKNPSSFNYRVGLDWVALEPVPADH